VFPSSDYGQIQFRNWIYGKAERIARDFNGTSLQEASRVKAAARKWGDPEPKEWAEVLPPSKESAQKRRIASKLEKLAPKVQIHYPRFADILRRAAGKVAFGASEIAKLKKKGAERHWKHPETHHLREMMDCIHHETGMWYDVQISEILILGFGLPENLYSPERLRQLRSRYASRFKSA